MSLPDASSSAGDEAVELAAMAGLHLDPWEEFVLANSLGEKPNGKWAAFEVGLVVSRQNGKGSILEARELAGLFLLGERLLIHSAHQFDTSLEAFRRLLGLIEDTPDLSRRVKRVSKSHGEEGIELVSGQRVRFRTRTKGGGRGFSCDCLVLDEAMEMPEATHGALLPTLSARPNSQVWYTGSAVDQAVHEHGVVLARVRERGLKGDDPSLAYFEWSVDRDEPTQVTSTDANDPELWAEANPGLTIRISPDHVANEQRSMEPRTFAVERMGVGDWPATDPEGGWVVIEEETWVSNGDATSTLADNVAIAFDVSPDRSQGSIGAAGFRRDGLGHVEVIENRPGTSWVVERLVELVRKHSLQGVTCDGTGPAASLIPELEAEGITVNSTSAKEHSQACGRFFDAVAEERLRHLDDSVLNSAVQGAVKRPLQDAWAWSRKSSAVDISPLVAVTLAHWGATQDQTSIYEDRGLITV